MVVSFSRICVLTLLAVLVSPPVFAEKIARVQGPQGESCHMEETAYINLSFRSIENDLSQISQKMEARSAEIQQMAKEAGLQSVLISSSSYNVNPSSSYGEYESDGATQYQLNGNVNFQVKPAAQAPAFMVLLLKKKGLSASLSVSSSRQCP